MNTDSPEFPDDSRDAAAYWFARVHSGNFTVAEQADFQNWRQSDPRHEQEYQALDEIWEVTSLVPEDTLRALLEAPEPTKERLQYIRRRWMVGVGASCVVAVAGSVLGYSHVLDSPEHVLRYATARGERRAEILPDGSVIEMNVATQLVVRYYPHRREVELVEGEASFDVSSNRDRPFSVAAGELNVLVTGTVFSVRREQDLVSVAVQSGSVDVSSGRWWVRDKATLVAGMMANMRQNGPLHVAQVDVAAFTAWRQGKVVFRDQPLEVVVREMNRYLAHPIHITDSRLKRLSMAGVFSIEDAEGFLQALQNQMPVIIMRRPDGGANLSLAR